MGLLDILTDPLVTQKLGEVGRKIVPESATLRSNFPRAYGFLGGLLGTAPDQMGGSVLDPNTQKVREGAGYGFPVGTALSVAPIFGGAFKAAGGPQRVGAALEQYAQKTGMQLPATVWHGSPHKFDKFDASKIGTGEGAQAYGHGLYLAESPKVAESYATGGGGFVSNSGKKNVYLDGNWLSSFDDKKSAEGLAKYAMTQSATGNTVAEKVATLQKLGRDDAASWLQQNAKRFEVSDGVMYKVDLPDEHIAKMLDWDKPLSQQPEGVRVAAMDLGLPPNATGKDVYNALANSARDGAIARGNNSATTLSASQAGASNDLRDFGIPGIRYLDGGSRGTGAGTSNFVVFPGNEHLLQILERNGQGLLGN